MFKEQIDRLIQIFPNDSTLTDPDFLELVLFIYMMQTLFFKYYALSLISPDKWIIHSLPEKHWRDHQNSKVWKISEKQSIDYAEEQQQQNWAARDWNLSNSVQTVTLLWE